jgi:hypothetical protein
VPFFKYNHLKGMTISIYKHILLKMLVLLLVNQVFAQQTFVQGFERTSNDNWNFLASPNTYNVIAGNDDDFWTDTTATNQISPATGNRLWYMLDLENTNGGGAFFHTLDFAPVDVSAFPNNTLTFKFYTIGYEAADSIGYILETDNGSNWDFSKYVDLNRNTQAWALVDVPVPAGAQFVRLRLMARQNGGSDYAAFDDVQLVSANGDIVPPVVTSANVLNSTTIQLVFSEPLDATADLTANYSGVANLSSALRQVNGDTVVLTFSVPFVNGQSNTLSVSGVQDLAGNANEAFDFSFIFNNSTPKLVITEINYNPPSTDPDLLEFIEIYNNGSQAAEIGGLQLGGLVSMTLPAIILQPGGTFLAAAYKAECEAFFAGQTFYPWNSSTALTNGGNTLVIRNSVGVTLDSVQYDDASPWPLEPDGFGPSVELLSPNLDNNDGANWLASTTVTADSTIFASPGIVNVISLPTIGFAATRSLVQENAGSATIQVNINNMNVPFAEAKLRVVSASTAVEGEDYVLLDTVVTFLQIAPDPFLIRVNLIDDGDQRNSRYLLLQLTDFVASEPGSIKEHNLLIHDNDTPAPAAQANAPISLSHLSSFSVDATTDATAEISAYDPASKRLFTTNIEQNKLEIIDLKNPVVLVKIASIDIRAYGGGINSVAISNGVVAVAVDDTLITNPGKIVFFNTDGVFVNQVTVGALPDHVNFTKDGSKLVVANEGEPATDYSVDPEGSVSVIDMTPGAAALTQANVTNIGFTQFDGDTSALRAAGVRIFGPTQSVARNIEPEFITASDDGKTAWVTLQEANAVAIIDLENKVATAIVPLGLKDWSNYSLDASDQAPGIFFNNWNIKGMYQPDAISYWNAGGNGYLITANEGDVREWDAYAEISRLGASAYKLDPVAFPDAAYLKRAELLGRLNVSTATGDTDGDGDFDEIHAYGGRSISIWNAATGALVWDSGDDLERITAADPTFGNIFNASHENNTRKNRSDDKGPEPEGIALGTIEGRNYAFAALERIGGVMVYDVTNPAAPAFVQWINTRTPAAYGGDQGAEGILFIPKNESPNGRNLLLLSNEVSGTVSVFQIDIDKTKTGEYDVTKYAFDNNPAIGVYGDTIREGGISGLMYRDGSFRFIGDRGPNADATQSPMSGGQTTLVFPFPDYAPKVWQVRPENGALTVEDFDFVKRPDGNGVSGLPLPVGQGNTGEVAWSDTLGTVVANDPWGLDSEGITQDNEGNFWICDEYGVSIWKLDQHFKVLNRYTPFPNELQDLPLDSLLGKRRANRGLEGITYAPNGKIFAVIQSPIDNPNTATGNTSRIHRLVELDPTTGAMRTFVYLHEPDLGQIRSRDWKLGDLIAINNEEFLTVEHAERNGWNSKNIYKFSIANATPVTGNDFGGSTLEQLTPAGLAANGIIPVQKEFYTDLLELGWERQHDKPEGLAILNDSTFAVINDNDFGISAPNADGKIVLTGKTTRLYVFGLPASKHLDYVNPYCKVDLGQDFVACGPLEAFLALGGQGFSQATWSDGNTDLNRIIDTAGTYAVTAINQFGCTARDTIILGQSDFPSVNLGENQTLCPGASATLDAGVFQTYAWSNGESTQTISVSSGGGYAVSVTNQFGCEGVDFVFITSAQNPTVDLGPNKNLCEGQIQTLDAGNSGADFLWSNGETTQTIAANTAGNYTVTVTSPEGCIGSDAVTLVNAVTPNVNLGNDLTTCEGQAVTLSNGYPGAATIWSTGATSPSITIETSGTYSVQVTLVTGCSDTDTVQVTVNPVPTVDLGPDSTLCAGQTLALNAGNPGAIYAWSNGATTQSISVDTENLYAVTVTNAFACTATDDVLVEVEICSGTKESDWAAGMQIFPNPTTGLVIVNLSTVNAAEVCVEVLNALGQVTQTHNFGKVSGLSNTLDLSSLAQGAYFLRVTVDGEKAVRRVMVQR